MRKVTLACGREGDYSVLRAAELTGLSSFQKPRKPPRYATGPNFASEICSRSTLWKVYILSSVGGGPNFSEGVHILP